MELKNGYKVIYEKIADNARTFYADKMDGTEATKLGNPIKVGSYKLVFEKDGKLYGSETGKIEDGVCLEAFNAVFEESTAEPEVVTSEVEDNKTPAEVEEPDAGDEPPVEDPAE